MLWSILILFSKLFFSCLRQLQVVSQAIELPKLSEAVPEQTARPPSELPVLQNLEKINEMAGVALVVGVRSREPSLNMGKPKSTSTSKI